MKKILMILFSMTSLTYAQKTARHSINIYAAPEYQHWLFISSSPYGFPNLMETEFGYSIGGNYKVHFGEKWYLQTGLEFNHYLPKTKNDNLPPNADINKSSITINQQTLGLGLKSGYHFLNKEKFSFGLEFGVNIRYVFRLENIQQLVYTDGTPDYNQTDDYFSIPYSSASRLLIEPTIGFSFHYKFNGKWSIFANPYFGMSVIPILKQSTIYAGYNTYPLRAGVQLGTEFTF